jgi:hypothetical protein
VVVAVVAVALSSPAPTSSTTTAGTAGSEAAAAAVEPARPATPPRAITARDWAKIAKDPDSYKGEAIIVYGEVTQFDATTGTDAFRADVDGVDHPPSYGYADFPTNTILGGEAETLSDIVEHDLFKAEVLVSGAYTYDTAMGGQTTVPLLRITRITRTGSTA